MINLKNKHKTIIAMIHSLPNPGTPKNDHSPTEIIEKAISEALLYKHAGVDALMIENMHDTPYLNRKVGAEVTAMMAIVAHEVKKTTGLPTGIQILAGANAAALAVAHAAGLDFIRAEGFVFSHIADEGVMQSDAGELLRYRKQIGAEDVGIFTDVMKKHASHAITSDLSITEWVKTADFFLSDGIIITGSSTGEKANVEQVKEASKNTNFPVIIGSGVTTDNLNNYWNFADAFIVGSHFKVDGYWKNAVSKERVENFMQIVTELRTTISE